MTSNPDPEALKVLGAEVRRARGDRHRTDIAALAKVSFRTVDRIEKAQLVRPAPVQLRKLLETLGIDVERTFASLGYEMWDQDDPVARSTADRLSSLESRMQDVEARLDAEEERTDLLLEEKERALTQAQAGLAAPDVGAAQVAGQ